MSVYVCVLRTCLPVTQTLNSYLKQYPNFISPASKQWSITKVVELVLTIEYPCLSPGFNGFNNVLAESQTPPTTKISGLHGRNQLKTSLLRSQATRPLYACTIPLYYPLSYTSCSTIYPLKSQGSWTLFDISKSKWKRIEIPWFKSSQSKLTWYWTG